MAVNDEDLRALFAPLHAEDFGLASTHLSEHAPVRVRLVENAGQPRVILKKLDAGSELANRLDAVRDESDEVRLGNAVNTLVTEVERQGAALRLADWLSTQGVVWAQERYRGLVVAIEVGAHLDVREVDGVIAAVLDDVDGDRLTRRVAAHRARHVRFRDAGVRQRVWDGVCRWVEAWIDRDPGSVARVVPSAAIGGVQSIDWLLGLIEHADEGIAAGAAAGLVDLFAGSTRSRVNIEAPERDRVVRAARDVRAGDRRRSQLGSTLVWLVGASATPSSMDDAVRVIYDAFQSGQGDEPAAAVAAARLLMRGSASRIASERLHQAFTAEPAAMDRFWRLVNHARPSWRS